MDIAYAKRRADGTFKEIDEVGRSLSADRRRKAKKKVKKGYGIDGRVVWVQPEDIVVDDEESARGFAARGNTPINSYRL